MRAKIGFSSILKILFLVTLFLVSITGTIQAQEGASSPAEAAASLESLDGLIETLENLEKREALLKELKTLRDMQNVLPEKEAAQGEKPNLVERVIIEYAQVTRETSGFFHGLFDLVRRAPDGVKGTMTYFSARENRAVLYRTAIIIGLGIATALIIILLTRRITSALLRNVLGGKEGTGRGKIYEAGIRMIIRVSPYVALFVGSFFVLNFLGVRGLLYQFATLFLLALLLYEAIFNVSRILLSPHAPETRIIPLADETSAYAWIWVRRFLNLWILYYFVTQSLEVLKAPRPLFAVISGVLIVFFPIISTVLLLQIKRMFPPSTERRPGAIFWDRSVAYCVRFWPLAAGALIWLISIFIVANYHEGIVFLIFAALKTLVALGIVWALLHLIDPLFNKLFSLGKEIKLRFPGLEEKTNRYVGTLKRVTKGVVFVIAIGSILEFWGLRASWFVTSEVGSTILSRAIAIGITVGIVLAVVDLSGFIEKLLLQPKTGVNGKIIEPGGKKKTLIPLFHWVIMVASVFIGGVVILGQLGVNITPILAGAGIAGLAVGFGAQSLVKDFINGLFLLFEGSVAVGDVVIINGTGGLVEGVTLRTIKMRDLAGNVHVIPNGSVDMITNMTKEYSRYVFDVGVAYREDVDEVTGILKEIGESMQNDPEYRDDILEPLEILGVDRFADSAVVIKARITTRRIKQWRIGREFNRRMKKVFDKRGIEIPFPHRTVYWGEPKTGEAPPLEVQLREQAPTGAEEEA